MYVSVYITKSFLSPKHCKSPILQLKKQNKTKNMLIDLCELLEQDI